MKTINDISLIDRYMRDELNSSQRRLLEKRMQSDPDFRHLYQDIDLFIEGIKESAAERTEEEKWKALAASGIFGIPVQQTEKKPVSSLLERLAPAQIGAAAGSFFRRVYQDWEQFIEGLSNSLSGGFGKDAWNDAVPGGSDRTPSLKIEKSAEAYTRRVILQVVSVAATVLILFIALSPLFNGNGSHFEYAMNDYTPATPKYWYTDRGSEENQLTSIAIDLEQGDYTRAATGLEAVIKDPDSMSTDAELFFLAFSYIKNENYSRAITLLEKIRNVSQTKKWGEDAAWFLVIAYGLNGQEDKANEVLDQILINPDHTHHDRARRLHEEITN